MSGGESFEHTRLAQLEELKLNGTITDDEFRTLTSAAIPSSRHYAGALEELGRWLLLVCLVASIIAVDHLKGPIFPDSFYCSVGAGVEIQQPAQRRANSWRAGNGCGYPDPQCATSWIETPASSICVHHTFWDAIKKAMDL